MENTATCGPLSSGYQHSDETSPPSGPAGGEGNHPLVNSCISHRFGNPTAFLVYPSAVKIVRTKYGQCTDITPPPVRTEIQGFSDHSRRRLRFLAGNSCVPLVSQFCLTYHQTVPDGRTVKRHLDNWLKRIRRRFPDVHYLWVLEFQTRGVPHFHVWLSLPHDLPGLHNILAVSWNKIAEPSSEQHLLFHKHRKNFIKWDMYSTSYLTKYLDKASQKAIPAGFTGCGRFWGNSTGLLATPHEITPASLSHLSPDETIDESTGEIRTPSTFGQALRIIGKHHERKIRRSRWKSRARTAMTSYTLQNSGPVLRQYLASLQRSYETKNNVPF